MHQQMVQLQEDMQDTQERFFVAEDERDSEVRELKEMRIMAEEANRKLRSELDSVKDNLKKAAMDFKGRERNMEKTRELELQLAEKNSRLDQLREELSVFKRSESQAKALFSGTQNRIEELETEHRNCKESEDQMKDFLASQTKQLQQTRIELEESKSEIETLHDKVKKLENSSSMKQELESLKSELTSTKQNLGLLKNELKLATEAEENNKKAMDDLALALKEVATEANQLKEEHFKSEAELEQAREEAENFKTMLRNSEEKYKALLTEARREADLYKSTVERLRLEAEESLLAWSGRETSLVDCIRRAEEDRFVAQQENRRLIDTLRLAELKNMTSKEEIKKLRDILKQALNEANVAKEAAGIAIEENSQLKDCLAEKENALDFLSSENENLKVNQAAALENIKELKQLLDEASKKEMSKEENKDQGEKLKPQNSVEKEENIVRRLGKAFSFSFMELRVNSEKRKEVEEEPEMEETLKGSIFDEVDSPGSATYHHKRSSSQFVEDGETVNDDDFDQLEENHFDDMENDRNSRKKKALIRRFGDLLMRRRSFHKKEQSPE